MPGPTKLRVTILGCGTLVWLASWIVPKPLRQQWLEKRRTDIWHWANFLAETGQLGSGSLTLVRNCWGSFAEALWLRYDREIFHARKRRLLRSPVACLAACVLVLTTLLLAGGFVPPTSSLFSQPAYQSDRVAVVSFTGKYVRIRSETLLYLGSVWRGTTKATQLALYSWGPSRLSDDWSEVPVVESRVGPEFFQLLGARAELGGCRSRGKVSPA